MWMPAAIRYVSLLFCVGCHSAAAVFGWPVFQSRVAPGHGRYDKQHSSVHIDWLDYEPLPFNAAAFNNDMVDKPTPSTSYTAVVVD